MFTRLLIKGGGRLATTRSLVNNSTSLVLKINLRNIQHQLLLRLPNQNLRQLVKYSDTLLHCCDIGYWFCRFDRLQNLRRVSTC